MRMGMAVGGALMAVSLLGATAPGAEARSRKLECKKGYQLYKEGPSLLKSVWSTVAQNPDTVTDHLTLTVDKSGSFETQLTASMEAEVGGGFGPFSASVKSQFQRTTVENKTVSKGAQYDATIKPHTQVRVRYGILYRTYDGVVLADKTGDFATDNPLTPVPIPYPADCDLRIATTFSVRATQGEPAFQRSKSAKYRG